MEIQMIDFADMDSLDGGKNEIDNSAEIRARAHVMNGGEATFSCPSCGGSGTWRGRGRCFKCQGKGRVSKGVAAAAKAKVTRANNFNAWCDENRDLIDGLRRHSWNNFLGKLLEQIQGEERKLSENQLIAAKDAVKRYDEKDAERKAQQAKEREEKAADIDMTAINALFDRALSSGLKRPTFYTERFVIKPARLHADTLYVTDNEQGGEYVGKIVHGRFSPVRATKPETAGILCEIAADPLKTAIDYGKKTGRCGCCGKELTNQASIDAGIGPICASKWF
jgi:hypothetical protein